MPQLGYYCLLITQTKQEINDMFASYLTFVEKVPKCLFS